MATHDKSRRKEGSYDNQRVINAKKDERKVKNKEKLGLCSGRDLGPRGSKDKLFKPKEN